jgi:hypothetical protein
MSKLIEILERASGGLEHLGHLHTQLDWRACS